MENKSKPRTFDEINKEITPKMWAKWLNHKSNKEVWCESQDKLKDKLTKTK